MVVKFETKASGEEVVSILPPRRRGGLARLPWGRAGKKFRFKLRRLTPRGKTNCGAVGTFDNQPSTSLTLQREAPLRLGG